MGAKTVLAFSHANRHRIEAWRRAVLQRMFFVHCHASPCVCELDGFGCLVDMAVFFSRAPVGGTSAFTIDTDIGSLNPYVCFPNLFSFQSIVFASWCTWCMCGCFVAGWTICWFKASVALHGWIEAVALSQRSCVLCAIAPIRVLLSQVGCQSVFHVFYSLLIWLSLRARPPSGLGNC